MGQENHIPWGKGPVPIHKWLFFFGSKVFSVPPPEENDPISGWVLSVFLQLFFKRYLRPFLTVFKAPNCLRIYLIVPSMSSEWRYQPAILILTLRISSSPFFVKWPKLELLTQTSLHWHLTNRVLMNTVNQNNTSRYLKWSGWRYCSHLFVSLWLSRQTYAFPK